MAQITGQAYVLLNPVTLGIMTASLVAAIALGSGTISIATVEFPISPRNISLGIFFGTILVSQSIDILFNSMPVFYGIICVPVYITFAFIMLEAGKD